MPSQEKYDLPSFVPKNDEEMKKMSMMANNFKKARIDIASRSQTKKFSETIENTDLRDNEENRRDQKLRGLHGLSSTNP